ncbi:MAG: biotin-dependent carboxyltransferase family protein [Henriciella sp.]|nr:biotin-dependent carboxyltransferase family protein [Henriciella sp.]
MLRILKAGLQSTLQGAPRIGHRHLGIPYAGPADPLSMALANRLVGNTDEATCVEITFGGFEAELETDCSVAITGAVGHLSVSGAERAPHSTWHLRKGDKIKVDPPHVGARTYLAIRLGFKADELFGSRSTYLPAAFGGYEGRALQAGDVLASNGAAMVSETLQTPDKLRPTFTHAFALRTCLSSESELLAPESHAALFGETFTAGRQATRMGVSLEGHPLSVASDGTMKSAPVFPGTIQCPPSGTPIVLLSDAQTTGGYPRIASIARCDRHLLGQIRPGDQVTLLHRTHEAALIEFAEKQAMLDKWLLRDG